MKKWFIFIFLTILFLIPSLSLAETSITPAPPTTYGSYTIYPDIGITGSWIRLSIKDTSGTTIDTLIISQNTTVTSHITGLKIKLVYVYATQEGIVIDYKLEIKQTIIPTTFSAHSVTSTPQGGKVYFYMRYMDNKGAVITGATCIYAISTDPNIYLLDYDPNFGVYYRIIPQFNYTIGNHTLIIICLKDGYQPQMVRYTITVTSPAAPTCIYGSANAAKPLIVDNYNFYADVGSNNNWARIVIKNYKGETLDTLIIMKGETKTTKPNLGAIGAQFNIKLIEVLTTEESTIIKADLAISDVGIICPPSCSSHAQCSQACTSLCPPNVYGCCYGCKLGQCVSGRCQCIDAVTYCSGSPSYQVGSKCVATTTSIRPTTSIPPSCSSHAQCSQACTSLCPPNVYGCCYGCKLGQCVSGRCQCIDAVTYCSGSPSYQVGSKCVATTSISAGILGGLWNFIKSLLGIR